MSDIEEFVYEGNCHTPSEVLDEHTECSVYRYARTGGGNPEHRYQGEMFRAG